jgi:predicted nucleic acid-binding Zn ribbon protein
LYPVCATLRFPARNFVKFGAKACNGDVSGGTMSLHEINSHSRPQEDRFMSLVSLVLVLIVVGVLLWLVNTYVPMDSKIKGILNAVVVIAVVLWLLKVFGLLATLTNIQIGK